MTDRNVPLDVLVEAALRALRPLGLQLRLDGWDANLIVNAPTAGERVVSLEIYLPAHGVPVEATAGLAEDRIREHAPVEGRPEG